MLGASDLLETPKDGTYRITTRLGQGVNLEHGVVGGHLLKGDIGVPSGAGEAADVAELMGQAAALLLLLAADDADLVAQLTALLGQRVDV